MTNMSYCRFRNTDGDLRDCLHNFDGSELDDGSTEELSEEEYNARENIIMTSAEILIKAMELGLVDMDSLEDLKDALDDFEKFSGKKQVKE